MGMLAKILALCVGAAGIIMFAVTLDVIWLGAVAVALPLLFLGEIIDLLKRIVEQTAPKTEE